MLALALRAEPVMPKADLSPCVLVSQNTLSAAESMVIGFRLFKKKSQPGLGIPKFKRVVAQNELLN
jgi:hypothetical protein